MVTTAEQALDRDEVVALYNSVGWTLYTKDPDKLLRSLTGSHLVLSARDDDGKLVGLARTISDDVTVCYVQDLLVHPDAQRQGIGTQLMQELQRRYAHCPFFLLSTDRAEQPDAAKSHPFYRALGMIPHEEQQMAAFALPVK